MPNVTLTNMPTPTPQVPSNPVVVLRHYTVDGSTFLDDSYLIRGVAGQLCRKLAAEYVAAPDGPQLDVTWPTMWAAQSTTASAISAD